MADSGATLQTIMAVLVGLLMLGLGATVSLAKFARNVRELKGPLVGLASQTLAMPFLAYILAIIFQFPVATTVSIIAIGCTPGGSTSNLFSYFSKGDVSLSITMTIISSALSFGTLPLLLWMLAEPFATSDLQIPFLNVVVALLLVVIPVAIGVTVRTNCIRVAWYLEKSATVLGSIFIIVAIVYGSITEADIFLAPATEWVTAFLLCFGGAGIGYGLAIASGLRRYQARTVALETGIQNSTLTIAILTFSFADTAFLGPVLRFPLLYSLVLIVCGVIMSGLFFWLARFDSEDDEHHRRAAELAEASATALESKHKPEATPKDGAIAHQAESKVGLVESGAASPGGAEA